MDVNIYNEIQSITSYLKLSITSQEVAQFCSDEAFTDEQIQAIVDFLNYMKDLRHTHLVEMLKTMSRIPSREPKTFENFDFSRIHGKNVDALKNLSSLSTLYAHKNLAFIGPQGVGKTHMAMAYGRLCFENEYKSYFLKATELNQKFTDARRQGRESAIINALVNPACLIIDEVGRCVFDKENTRMFFDVIDRRYSKDGPNNMIFTSNKSPDKWGEYFGEDSSLLCALDRIFDDAMVFMIKGNSYRGSKCETVAITAGELSPLNNK